MALATAAIYALKTVAPVVSLSVVYLPAVLIVAAYWGLVLGLLTSLPSAAAFNFFHLPPIGRFTIADSRNWVALAAFVLVAAVVSTMAELARGRAAEAERRRREADLAADARTGDCWRGRRATALGCARPRTASPRRWDFHQRRSSSAPDGSRAPRRARAAQDGRRQAGGDPAGPARPRGRNDERLRNRVVPALGALVAVALHRDAVQTEAVETAALRRSDELKTALLQAVSHDLRTPLTAIVAAGHALGARSLTARSAPS